ncbi:MAG TPA: glycosyltransferase family 39 protein [Ktedonobacterales bacterium]|nr:glycosyltransferase family 39 protein [Ktedonobacterales bacterium]
MTTQAKSAQANHPLQHVGDGRWLYPALAVAILALCVVFHVYRLAQSPGWDPQEGYNLDIAWNLAHGRLRLFALSSDFAQHPPLFYLQLALAIRLLGYDIVAVRALAAAYAILTCGALLIVGRRLVGDAATLWGAVVFTVAPVILANTRWGYTYAQLSFVGVLCLGATGRAVARYHAGDATRGWRWLLVAATLAGLATFSDYEGIAWVAFVALVALALPTSVATTVANRPGGVWGAWRARLRAALAPLGVGLAIPIIGLLACLLIAPSLFVADLAATLGRVSGGGPIVGALSLLLNYYTLVTYDPWLTAGLFGLLFLSVARGPHPRLAPTGLRISLPRTREREERREEVGVGAVDGERARVAAPPAANDAPAVNNTSAASAASAANDANFPFPQGMGRGRGLGLGWLLPLSLATLGLVSLATRPIGLSFHTATPLLALLALGAGLALEAATRIVRQQALAWLGAAPTPGPSPEESEEVGVRSGQTFSGANNVSAAIPLPVGEGRVGTSATRPPFPNAPNAPSTSVSPSRSLSRRAGEGNASARRGQARAGAALVVFLVVISPIALAAASDLAGLATTLPTRQDAILATPGDAQAMARYVFAHAHAGDLVLASPEVAWMFDRPADPAPQTQGADILQTLAQTGQAAAFYPAGLPASRWAYPVALSHARYVVVDNLVRQLATPTQLPALIPILSVAEHWPVVYTSGQYTVYAQPNVA